MSVQEVLLCSWTSALTSTGEGKCKEYSQQGWMKYQFYSSVSLSILVGTTGEGRGPNANWGMMKLLSGQASSVLFLPPSEEVVLAFSVVCLWSPSLFFSYDSSSWRRQRLPFQQTQPLPFRAKRQAVEERRQQERSREAGRTERRDEEKRGEKSMQFHPPRRSPAAPSSQYPTSRRPYSETHLMNTPALIQPHNGALHCHWACSQWRTSLQLNPRDNELG